MDINKVIYRGIKVGMILVIALLVVYCTMQASFAAFDFGYRYAIESLIDNPTENTESTGK